MSARPRRPARQRRRRPARRAGGPRARGRRATASRCCAARAAAARPSCCPASTSCVVWRAPWIDPEPDARRPRPTSRRSSARLAALAARRGGRSSAPSTRARCRPRSLLRLAGVPCVAATSVDYPGSLLDVRHRIADDVHEVERALDLAAAPASRCRRGDDGAPAHPRRRRRRRAARRARTSSCTRAPPCPRAPGRRSATRRSSRALADAGRRCVVTGAPAERALTARVAGPPQPAVPTSAGARRSPSWPRCSPAPRCVVVGNTGPAHLAAAVGTPVVSLFAPTVPAVRWRPWRVPHELLVRRRAVRRLPRARLPGRRATRASAASAVDDVLGAVERARAAAVGVAA